MVAVFAWLDTSEHDRRRALDVIDLFRQKETVDELGLGSVRDTIADVLAPGTSTIQTRARYFFFVPWMYLALERSGKSERLPAKARQRETDLISRLGRAPDNLGTIGIDAGPRLRRLPSQIYWAGLGRLHFRLFPGSQDQYHRILEKGDQAIKLDDAGDLSIESALPGHWHPHLPPAPEEFPHAATFELRKSEAEFFRDQLRMHADGSILRFLVDRGEPVGELAAPWQHPARKDMPDVLQTWLTDGQNFSELMHGAQLLYNLLLSEARKNADLIENYRKRLLDWAKTVADRQAVYAAWNRPVFWGRLIERNGRLPTAARVFSERWIELVLDYPAARLAEHSGARILIDGRERQLKGPRARLHSQAHLDLWGGASGTEALNYRWSITRRLINDIVAGWAR